MSTERVDPDEWDDEDGDFADLHARYSPQGDACPEPRPQTSSRLCPSCRSAQIRPRHLARRVASVIGAAAGITTGVVRVLQAAELASGSAAGVAALGLRAAGGPVIGTIAGAVAAALLEGATGCALGVKFGEAIDRVVLPNYRCTACGHLFGLPIDAN